MNKVIGAILLLNLILAVIYGIVKLSKKQSCSMVILFITVPVLGFVLYFVPGWISKAIHGYDYDRETLVRRTDIERSAMEPMMQEELDVVPVEDAMAVSENKRKRALLLSQLKKDYANSCKLLLSAENDSDSESAHYIAAAKMESYSVLQKKWSEQLKLYEENPTDQNWIAMIRTLADMIDSDLLSAQEQKIYKKKYVQRFEEYLQEGQDWDAYTASVYLRYLGDLEKYEDAVRFWNQHKEHLRCEEAYMAILVILFNSKNTKLFRECIQEIKADKDTKLSSEGLSQLRYWINKDMD